MAVLSLLSKRPSWLGGAAALTTRWLESTMEVARWENMRRAGRRWGWWGVGLGSVAGVVAYAPAAWLAGAVNDLSGQHLVLAEAQGTIWNGDAVAVLTGGPGSRDARALPGRLAWRMGAGVSLKGLHLKLALHQDCCMPLPVVVVVRPGIGQTQVELKVQPTLAATPMSGLLAQGEIGHWPAAWLGGLGSPWNALDLRGVLRLQAQDVGVTYAQGRLRVSGHLNLGLDNLASKLSTLDRLGSYRVDMAGDAQGLLQIGLSTTDGALRLSGQGSLGSTGLRFQGEAQASEAEQAALDNLLTLLGRRMGDRTVISIG
jgi:general secretion pathway protein N